MLLGRSRAGNQKRSTATLFVHQRSESAMAAAVTLPGDDLRIVDDLVSGAADAAAAGESGAQADQVGRTEGYVELGRRGRRSTTNAN